MDWTRRTCYLAVLADSCCDDIKHAMRHRADCLNTYCKNMPFSIKWCVQLSVFNSDPYGRTPSPAHNSNDMFESTCSFTKNYPLCMAYYPFILSARSCYILCIIYNLKNQILYCYRTSNVKILLCLWAFTMDVLFPSHFIVIKPFLMLFETVFLYFKAQKSKATHEYNIKHNRTNAQSRFRF